MQKKRLLTVVGFAGLILVMVALPFMAACAETAPAPPKVITWRLHTEDPAGDVEVNAYQEFANAVKADTGGQLVIEIFPGGALGLEHEGLLTILESGAIELVVSGAPWIAGIEPLMGVGELPFLLPGQQYKEKMGEIAAPYFNKTLARHGVTSLARWSNPPTNLLANKKVPTMEDWKGLKLRSWSAPISALYEAMGATAVSMAKSEAYTAMQTGVIDGSVYSSAGIIEMHFYEVIKNVSLWGASSGLEKLLLVDSASYNALPKDVQDAIQKHLSKMERTCWDEAFWVEEESLAALESYGCTIVPVSPAEIAKAANRTKSVWSEWLDKTGAEGLELLNAILKLSGQAPYS